MPMRNFERANVVDEELHDLKLRFELLEGDRKAYYETSQWAIRQNKEEISKLRLQNKELSEAIARIKKSEVQTSGNRLSMTDLEKFDQRICEIHKRYDELLAEARRKEDKVRLMKDQLSDYHREEELVKSNMKDSTKAKEIRTLENRLDKAMIKYNEAQSIRKTYDQIIKKLQEEQLTFDSQLANFEKTLKAKKQDAADLELMSQDANHAKEVAKAELARFEQQINEERKQREKDLQARKELVKKAMEDNDRLDSKTLRMDDTANDVNVNNDNNKDNVDEAMEKKLAEYEETMRVIKEVTGVSDINEVVAKFKAQGDTHNHLNQLQKQNEQRLKELVSKKAQVLAEYEDLKYSGETRHAHTRQMIDEFEKHCATAQAKCADALHKYERVAKNLASAQAGIQHLFEKLEIIGSAEKTAKVPMSDETVVRILETCVKKLETLGTSVAGKELPEAAAPQTTQPTQQQPVGEPMSILQVNPAVLPSHNCRVKMRPVEFEEQGLEDEDEDDGEYEVPDRESIKRHTTQMLNARQPRQRKGKGKKAKALDDI